MRSKKSLIVVLLMLVLCLIGLSIRYGEKHFIEDKSSAMAEEMSSIVEKPVAQLVVLPGKSDSGLAIGSFYKILTKTELESNFRNLKKQINGHTLIFNCKEYDEIGSSCAKIILTINNEFTFEEQVPYALGVYSDITFYKVNNYYVAIKHINEGGVAMSEVEIYKGNEKIFEGTARNSYQLFDSTSQNLYNSNDYIGTMPVIVNNVLHFVERGKNVEDSLLFEMKYNTIDLSKDNTEVKLVKDFYGYCRGER